MSVKQRDLKGMKTASVPNPFKDCHPKIIHKPFKLLIPSKKQSKRFKLQPNMLKNLQLPKKPKQNTLNQQNHPRYLVKPFPKILNSKLQTKASKTPSKASFVSLLSQKSQKTQKTCLFFCFSFFKLRDSLRTMAALPILPPPYIHCWTAPSPRETQKETRWRS